MTDQPDKPSEWTYQDYMASVDLSAEVATEMMVEYPEDYPEPWAAVESAIQGDERFTNWGHMLITVLLTDQNPEHPNYTERWQQFVRWDPDDPPTWSDCVGEMARVCYYSDVMGRLIETPPTWDEIGAGPSFREGWESTGVEIVRVFLRGDERDGFEVERVRLVEGEDWTDSKKATETEATREAPTETAAKAVAVRLMREA